MPGNISLCHVPRQMNSSFCRTSCLKKQLPGMEKSLLCIIRQKDRKLFPRGSFFGKGRDGKQEAYENRPRRLPGAALLSKQEFHAVLSVFRAVLPCGGPDRRRCARFHGRRQGRLLIPPGSARHSSRPCGGIRRVLRRYPRRGIRRTCGPACSSPGSLPPRCWACRRSVSHG